MRRSIRTYGVWEIVTLAQDEFDGVSEPCSGEFVGDHVALGRTGAGEQDGGLLKAPLISKRARNVNRPLKKCAYGRLFLPNTFINLDAAESAGTAPAAKSV